MVHLIDFWRSVKLPYVIKKTSKLFLSIHGKIFLGNPPSPEMSGINAAYAWKKNVEFFAICCTERPRPAFLLRLTRDPLKSSRIDLLATSALSGNYTERLAATWKKKKYRYTIENSVNDTRLFLISFLPQQPLCGWFLSLFDPPTCCFISGRNIICLQNALLQKLLV